MEMEKRKRSHNGEVDGRRTRAKEGKGDLTADQAETETTGTATEEEVEEFFAILRRVREVVRYFGKGKNGGGEEEMKRGSGKGWNPSFQWEDFEDVQGKQCDGVVSDKNKDSKIKGRGGEKRDVEAVEENLVLDLNAEPESLSDMN
ncbi:protein NIM1-INTERACTING 2 [Macadamia integrifolia]|uniref:protein NIM1-INTERACTING 2 n=1 Tax=Macadamia integrifolia TaxID=60698 RepID=UPI001C4E7DCE|nr:protein NIM1-INTERACTING 2 [Macadamia integrifolia]